MSAQRDIGNDEAATSTAQDSATPASTSRPEEPAAGPRRGSLWPRVLFLITAIAFGLSHIFPWWSLKLNAPQYPLGLKTTVFTHDVVGGTRPFNLAEITDVEGNLWDKVLAVFHASSQVDTTRMYQDVKELDGLNHYIGMISMSDAASFERSIAVYANWIFFAMAILAFIIGMVRRDKWSPLLMIPVIIYPIVFAADMFYWLWYAGNHLDPTAALDIPPFTPTFVGVGKIVQFTTEAALETGFWIATVAAVISLIGVIWAMRTSCGVPA